MKYDSGSANDCSIHPGFLDYVKKIDKPYYECCKKLEGQEGCSVDPVTNQKKHKKLTLVTEIPTKNLHWTCCSQLDGSPDCETGAHFSVSWPDEKAQLYFVDKRYKSFEEGLKNSFYFD
jgi:hypothetical protein